MADPCNWPYYKYNIFSMIREAKINAFKVLVSCDMDSTIINQLRDSGVTFIMGRIFAKLNNKITPKQVYDDIFPALSRCVVSGITYMELLNEPNIPGSNQEEGFGVNWNDGYGFQDYYLELRSLIKTDFPQVKCGYPGLSPNGTGEGEVSLFVSKSKYAYDISDFINIHLYSTSNGYDIYTNATKFALDNLTKEIVVSEFSIVSDMNKTYKGQYYRDNIYNKEYPTNLLGLMSFVASSSNGFTYETWYGSDIPKIVGSI